VRLTDSGERDVLLSTFATGDRVFQWLGRLAWGVQFHLEIDAQGVEAWLQVAEPALSRVWKRTADEVRDELRMYLDAQQQRSRALLAAFAGMVRSANPLAD